MTSPADPYQTALSEFGAIGVFAASNPEVNDKLQQAIANKWDAARFERELWTTNWWKNQSEQLRQLQVMQATDPGKYAQTINAKAADIISQAGAMGKSIDQATANQYAHEAIAYGYSDAIVQKWLATNLNAPLVDGRMGAQSGEVENHIRSTYAAYGMPITDQAVWQQVNQVLAGTQTTGGLDNQIIAQASKLFPQYAQDFTEGRTLSQIAQPFMQQMAQTLEIDPSHINVTDPTIMQALHGDGNTPATLYQFQQQLKSDPRWGKTDNAKQAAYDTVAQIKSDWGF